MMHFVNDEDDILVIRFDDPMHECMFYIMYEFDICNPMTVFIYNVWWVGYMRACIRGSESNNPLL